MSYANHTSPQKRARDPPLSLLHKTGKSRFWTAFRIHGNAVLAHLAQDRAEAIKVVSFDHCVAFFDQSVVLPFVDRQRSFICQLKEHVDEEAGLLQHLVKKNAPHFRNRFFCVFHVAIFNGAAGLASELIKSIGGSGICSGSDSSIKDLNQRFRLGPEDLSHVFSPALYSGNLLPDGASLFGDGTTRVGIIGVA
jgi:hypothetical protein